MMPEYGKTNGLDGQVGTNPTPTSGTQPQVEPTLPNMESLAASENSDSPDLNLPNGDNGSDKRAITS